MILVGDLFITLYLTTRADRYLGRRNVMITGALLKVGAFCADDGLVWDVIALLLYAHLLISQVLAGVVFASTNNFWGLLVAGIIGVISTSGGECGPFIAVEQARVWCLWE